MTNIAEEWVNHAHSQLKDEEACRVATIKTLAITEKKFEDLGMKLTERERESVEASLASAEKQAKDQHQQLCKVEE